MKNVAHTTNSGMTGPGLPLLPQHPLIPFPDIFQFNQPFNAPLLCANCLQMQQQLCNHLWPANEKRFTCRQAGCHSFPTKKKVYKSMVQ